MTDLRARRHLELSRQIADVALDLFERRGVAAVTVDDIAQAAGISRRTFFRHCAGKEAAVLLDEAGLQLELLELARQPGGLDGALEAVVTAFDADARGRERFLRLRRLLRANPGLAAAALQRETELTERIAAAVAEGTGIPPLDARAVAERFALTMRLAFDEWVRRADHADPVPLAVVAADARAALDRAGVRS